jgi:NAD(P)H dehydrogenase (quinone)
MKKILLNGVDGNFGGKSAKVLLDRYPHEDLIFTAPTEKGGAEDGA